MKTIYICFYIILLAISNVHAQDECSRRYRDKIFNQIEFKGNVEFGIWQVSPNVQKKLHYDVYMPKDDTAALRPLVILWHGGAFLDMFTKTSPDIVMMAKDLAKRGFVVISPDYRGIRDLSSFLRKEDLVKEVVGAAMDGNKAVCHILSQIEDGGNPFRINKDEIFAGGVSGGSVMGLHLLLLQKTEDLPEPYWGWAREVDNGEIDVTLANKFCGMPNAIKGFINISGALIDTSFIQYTDVHFLHSHGTKDDIVPFNIGQPLGGITDAPDLYGSNPIHEKLLQVGTNSTFKSYEGIGHVPFLNIDLVALLQQLNIVNIEVFEETIQASLDMMNEQVTCEKINTPTGIFKNFASEFKLYPNPSIEQITTIAPYGATWQMNVYDTQGKMVLQRNFVGSQASTSISTLSEGIYVVQLTDLDQRENLYIQKLIKFNQ